MNPRRDSSKMSSNNSDCLRILASRALMLLLLLTLIGYTTAFSAKLPNNNRIHQTSLHHCPRATGRDPLQRENDHEPEPTHQKLPLVPPQSKTTGERRRKLRSWLRSKIPLPTKRNLVCLAIAVTVYLRGLTLPGTLGGGYDPNVAHAGVKVKITAIKLDATIKDITALLPQGKPAPGPRSVESKPVLRIPKVEITTGSDLYRAGTVAVAAGGGILVGILARPPKSVDNNESMTEADDEPTKP